MDLGYFCRYYRFFEEVDFFGNNGIVEGYWRVVMEYQFVQEREYFYIYIYLNVFIICQMYYKMLDVLQMLFY